jgi:hypothetical protein
LAHWSALKKTIFALRARRLASFKELRSWLIWGQRRNVEDGWELT